MNRLASSVDGLRLSSKGTLGGIAYSRDTLEQLCASLRSWLRDSHHTTATVGYVNPHVFNLAMKSERLRRFLAEADIVAVDGIGVALGVMLLRRHFQTRTVMTPLFDRILAAEDFPARKAALFGGTDEVAEEGAASINRVGRRIQVVAFANGYRVQEDYLNLLREHPEIDLVLVAMGTPRSEELILAAREHFDSKLFWNIGGGTLHFYAGTLARVPTIVSALWMQWLWRIIHEPRIAPRYVVGTPIYLAHLLNILVSRHND